MIDPSGIIFDIKRFAIHDGPGIRTTIFLKGCPLRCIWCHNPEGISLSKEMFYHEYKCISCGNCIDVCPNDVNGPSKNGIILTRDTCTLCGKCIEICPSGARQLVGHEITTQEIFEEIKKDVIYFDASEGGVTFSGGEPLKQPIFIKSILEKCKKNGIHTTLDTSGYSSHKTLASILECTDLVLYDLKIIDDKKHQRYTGVSNKFIIKNLKTIVNSRKNIILRFPVIPEITDTEKNINELITFISSLKRICDIDLLPFHNVVEKYRRLGKTYMLEYVKSPSQEKLLSIKDTFEQRGFHVRIGG